MICFLSFIINMYQSKNSFDICFCFCICMYLYIANGHIVRVSGGDIVALLVLTAELAFRAAYSLAVQITEVRITREILRRHSLDYRQ